MSEREATQISLQFSVQMPPGTGYADLHAHGERVMDELLNLEQCNSDFTDSTVSTDAAESTITVELLILGTTDPTAVLKRTLDLLRTAVHAAGGATPTWPVLSEQPEQVRMETTHELAPATP